MHSNIPSTREFRAIDRQSGRQMRGGFVADKTQTFILLAFESSPSGETAVTGMTVILSSSVYS
ncbi:MAG: hypothetical protein ACMUIS_05540 [bacterium]